jgi:hypothetical protein
MYFNWILHCFQASPQNLDIVLKIINFFFQKIYTEEEEEKGEFFSLCFIFNCCVLFSLADKFLS